jgi:hypothetical protein
MTIIAIAFNTGRGYSSEGQRIVAQVLTIEIIGGQPAYLFAFADLDRHIYGRATCYGKFDQNNVMAAYDAGNYAATWSDCDITDAARDYRELAK